MSRCCALLSALVLAVPVSAAPIPKKAEVKDQIPLADHANGKLDENLHSNRYENNNLKALKPGAHKLGGVTFEVGEKLLQLGSSNVAERPEKFEGIRVGRTAAKLHFLQACGYSAEAGETVAKYVVHYADKTTAEIEVVYGKHVVDWWGYPDQKGPTDAEVAWEGENEAAKGFMAKVKLYRMTWANPHPDKEIAALDFATADPKQACAPFCVAITAEAAKAEPKKDEDKKDGSKKDEKR
jgi:hypothetical protein